MTPCRGQLTHPLTAFVEGGGGSVGVGARESKEVGLGHLCTHNYPLQQWGAPTTLVFTETTWGACWLFRTQAHTEADSAALEGLGDLRFKQVPSDPGAESRAPLPETLLCRDGELILEGGLRGGGGGAQEVCTGEFWISYFCIIPSLTAF